MARRDERGVRLLTRNGYDFADRFPLITQAVEVLPVRSCFIDGEAIVVNSDGLSVYDLLRYRQHDGAAVLCAFDLIELDGEDFRTRLSNSGKTFSPIYCAGCSGRSAESR
jgi:bifunctional non-homologous end joining protein LigD